MLYPRFPRPPPTPRQLPAVILNTVTCYDFHVYDSAKRLPIAEKLHIVTRLPTYAMKDDIGISSIYYVSEHMDRKTMRFYCYKSVPNPN